MELLTLQKDNYFDTCDNVRYCNKVSDSDWEPQLITQLLLPWQQIKHSDKKEYSAILLLFRVVIRVVYSMVQICCLSG